MTALSVPDRHVAGLEGTQDVQCSPDEQVMDEVVHAEPQPPRFVPWTTSVCPLRTALWMVGGGPDGVVVGRGVLVGRGVSVGRGVRVLVRVDVAVETGVTVEVGVSVGAGVFVAVGQKANAAVSWIGRNAVPGGLE